MIHFYKFVSVSLFLQLPGQLHLLFLWNILSYPCKNELFHYIQNLDQIVFQAIIFAYFHA